MVEFRQSKITQEIGGKDFAQKYIGTYFVVKEGKLSFHIELSGKI